MHPNSMKNISEMSLYLHESFPVYDAVKQYSKKLCNTVRSATRSCMWTRRYVLSFNNTNSSKCLKRLMQLCRSKIQTELVHINIKYFMSLNFSWNGCQVRILVQEWSHHYWHHSMNLRIISTPTETQCSKHLLFTALTFFRNCTNGKTAICIVNTLWQKCS
jgi:hypothetical protein